MATLPLYILYGLTAIDFKGICHNLRGFFLGTVCLTLCLKPLCQIQLFSQSSGLPASSLFAPFTTLSLIWTTVLYLTGK